MVTLTEPSERTTARLYRVQAGDDLRKISIRVYGRPDFWHLLYRANAKAIEKNGIRAGEILYVPGI